MHLQSHFISFDTHVPSPSDIVTLLHESWREARKYSIRDAYASDVIYLQGVQPDSDASHAGLLPTAAEHRHHLSPCGSSGSFPEHKPQHEEAGLDQRCSIPRSLAWEGESACYNLGRGEADPLYVKSCDIANHSMPQTSECLCISRANMRNFLGSHWNWLSLYSWEGAMSSKALSDISYNLYGETYSASEATLVILPTATFVRRASGCSMRLLHYREGSLGYSVQTLCRGSWMREKKTKLLREKQYPQPCWIRCMASWFLRGRRSEQMQSSKLLLLQARVLFESVWPPRSWVRLKSCLDTASVLALTRANFAAGKVENRTADLQRKFQPQQNAKLSNRKAWEEAFLCCMPSEMAEQAVSAQTAKQSIIIVASLLDRVPNLAGLTRTCEIFRAEALVLADLSVVRDPDFAGISVTAERHVDMRVNGRLTFYFYRKMIPEHISDLDSLQQYAGLSSRWHKIAWAFYGYVAALAINKSI